jgi:pyruvate formate lyase activating enzyme
MCKNAGIHTALDTSGYARWETLRQILEYVDLVLYDFKQMNTLEHKKHTGVPNGLILDNAKRIYQELHIPMLARVPLVPGCNDSVENIKATAQFVTTELGMDVKVHLLPYHRLGEAKYERLENISHSMSIQPPSDDHVLKLKELIESLGLKAYIGG